jgi:hypothetical protein
MVVAAGYQPLATRVSIDAFTIHLDGGDKDVKVSRLNGEEDDEEMEIENDCF